MGRRKRRAQAQELRSSFLIPNSFQTPKSHKGSADLWATAASADLLHWALVACRSSQVAGCPGCNISEIRDPIFRDRSSSLVARDLGIPLCLLTYFTLPYILSYLPPWPSEKRLYVGSRSPREKRKSNRCPLTVERATELAS